MVLPIGADAVSSKIFLATDGDSVSAFLLESKKYLHFWSKKNGKYVKVGQHVKGLGAYIGSICTADKAKFIFETDNGKNIVQYEISLHADKEAVTSMTLNVADGKPVQNFIHDGEIFNLTFFKNINTLRVRRFEAEGKEIDTYFVLPRTRATAYANTNYADLKKLHYRKTDIANPSTLYDKQHIYIANNTVYLVYPKYTGTLDLFVILKLDLNDQKVDRRIIHPANAANTDNANLYFTNNSFLLYTISDTQLILSTIDPASWEIKDFYSLSGNDEKLQDVPLRQDGTKMWWEFLNGENKPLDQKKLLKKLYMGGAAYVFTNPIKDTTGMQEIVIGSYLYAQVSSGGGSVPGAGFSPVMNTQTHISNPYVMLQYNNKENTMQPSQTVWRSPVSVWYNLHEELNKSKMFSAIDPTNAAVHNLGDRALIAYVDRKREAVIVRYESLN